MTSEDAVPDCTASIGRIATTLLDHDCWSREQLLDHQEHLLAEMLKHVVASSPYYRQKLGGALARGVTWTELPTLDKAGLVANFDQIVTDRRVTLATIERHLAAGNAAALLFDQFRICATGGTTGMRALMVYDREAWGRAAANGLRFMSAIGATPGMRTMLIGSPTPLHLSNRLLGALQKRWPDMPELYVTTPLPEMVAALNRAAPEVLITYASLLRQLMHEQLEGRLRIAPRIVGSNAEVLTDDVRDLGRRAWGVAVHDRYATTEIGMSGVECREFDGIHLPEDLVLFEAVDEANRPVPPKTRGSKLLVTTLVNRVLPLIRYELSDRVAIDPAPCRCGRPYARMIRIDGRTEEVLRLPRRDGGSAEIHALRLQPALIGVPGVRQFQLVPRGDRLEVRLVLREGADEIAARTAAERDLAALLEAQEVDPDRIRVEIVDAIERTGTGAKLRLVGTG